MIHTRQQRGSIAPFMVLALGGALLATAYALDTSRLTNSATQVKRATDAAALAIGNERVTNGAKSLQELKPLAYSYIANNLGLDSTLAERISQEQVTLSKAKDDEGRIRYTVTVAYEADSELLGAEPKEVQVFSTVEVQPSALEVVLTLPNSGSEDARNLTVLRRLGNHFAEELLEGRDDAWLALVPFSQTVNVSPDHTNPDSHAPRGPSAEHMKRLNSWAASTALRPKELASLFRPPRSFRGLHDARIPDRRANLLCLYRGMNMGENYHWDTSPAGQFRIYYRADLPDNGSPGADPVNWVGPNPWFGVDSGQEDTRWMVADKGCPSAPLLPLTNDLAKIEERLDQMSTRFNTNYAIAMGWSAMALAPAFRGASGWNLPDDLPHDFKDDGGDSYKAVVMLVNTTDERWFDSDGYNAAEVGTAINGNDNPGGEVVNLRTERFARLCDSFRERKLRFFLIAVGSDEVPNNDVGAEAGSTIESASWFRRFAGPGLARCAVKSSDITYMPGLDFAEAETAIQSQLNKVLEEIRQQGSFVRLVE